MSSIDLSPSEVVFILISSMIIVSFIVAKLSKKEGIEEEEKEKEKEEKKEEEKRKQFKKLSEECFLDIKNLSKYHKMVIYVYLFFSVLQNNNKENS
ncbi:MAG: hypothetical protein RMJ67_09950, partial [Elusimicrobiota bacterium]|nr:hypothetical protein [Endomicrobiia bacterium]MDW8166817.1 hypothetical protein [Elusimicrobiota bacterium]